MTIYKLVWDDLCSWYLEIVKPGFEKPIDRTTYDQTIIFFKKCLTIMHPFMPFISEEIWSKIKSDLESPLIISDWPCLLYTSPSPRDQRGSRMPSSA